MSNYNYNNLTPFKWFVLENFPFIEADFDAITNYQLYCKVVEYLNQCIDNVNDIGNQMENVTNQMTALQNYVDNYFENLNVQTEINNKLDDMAEDGTLTSLISNYVNPYITQQNQNIENFENTVTTQITNINNMVSGLSSGTPIPVSSTSDMTDESKVYLNTSNNYWYYYDGTDWVQGGVYPLSEVLDNTITPSKTTFVKNIKNLYNSSLYVANKYWSNPNTLTEGSNCYYMASPIKLKPNTTYYYKDINFYFNFCWLSNEAKTDYSKLTDIVSNNTFSTTSEKIYLYVTNNQTINSNGLLIAEDDYSNILTQNDEYIFKNKEFYCGSNKQFTTLKSAVEYANQFANATLYVDAGTYDLVQEYGESYLNSNNVKGLELKNGLKIIFTAKSKVTFHYTGTNSFIKREFSPFNTGVNGGTLENCIIDCSNCRYCVHDERGFSKDSYNNLYKNCEFYIDNSNNSDWDYQEISVAGGFGLNGIIKYENCVLDKQGYYHQNADDNETQSRCEVYFIGNIVKHGNFHVNPGHSSLPKSKFFACGNITETAIPSTASDSNVASYLFNNSLL